MKKKTSRKKYIPDENDPAYCPLFDECACPPRSRPPGDDSLEEACPMFDSMPVECKTKRHDAKEYVQNAKIGKDRRKQQSDFAKRGIEEAKRKAAQGKPKWDEQYSLLRRKYPDEKKYSTRRLASIAVDRLTLSEKRLQSVYKYFLRISKSRHD